jgi:NDP-sugar pyrophosphorylase family protein
LAAAISKGMILAAGEGTRLRPLTLDTPKAVVPIGGIPLIAHTVHWLVSHGIVEVMINLHYQGEKIVASLGDGSALGAKISYSWESALLGTAGGVKRCEGFFGGPFVVIYGDVLTDCDLTALIAFHRQRQAVATLALYEAPNPWEAGIVQTAADGKVLDFIEKPLRGSEVGNMANSGLYVLEREVLAQIDPDRFSDFGFHVLPRLIAQGVPVWGYRLPDSAYLLDIGSPEKYRRANLDAAAGAVNLPLLASGRGPKGTAGPTQRPFPNFESGLRGDERC